MKRIPKALVGKPRLCKAWLWKKENPSASSYEMGKHASYRPQDGWRIEKEFEKLDVNEENKADAYIQPFLVQEFLIKY